MPRSTSSSQKKPTKRAASGRAKSSSGSKTGEKTTSFANYHAAVRYLLDSVNIERSRADRVDHAIFKLDRIAAILAKLGNPQEGLRIVHIAGTNGKGSTVAMVSAALQACGFTVGAYTSPHLTDIRERVQINNAVITHPAFTELMGRVAEAAESVPKKHGPVTYFELLTALSLLYFAEKAVDVAIMETGLGGRLDATNVVTPDVTAITSISIDHTQFLGKTVEEIAREKAGIFKPGVPALTIPQDKSVVEVLRAVAAEVGTTLEVIGEDIEFSYRFEANPKLGPHTRVGLSTDRVVFEHVPVPLKGEHQAANCGLALAIVDKLADRGFDLPTTPVVEGLAGTVLSGRMEIVGSDPRVLLDGAHNPAALQALIRSIGANVPYDSLVMVFGCSADKDVDELLKRVSLGADKVIFTRAKGNPRAADPEELLHRFQELSPKMAQVAPKLEEALNVAARAASREDLICVTGSFYLVGEAKKFFELRAARAKAAAHA